MSRKTTGRAVLAGVAVAAATLGMSAAPATAAEVTAGSVAVAGNGYPYSSKPEIAIWYGSGAMFGPSGILAPVQAGHQIQLYPVLTIGGKASTYTDVHFRTSHPGTATCDINRIYQGGQLWCDVKLPAMKPGTSQIYWITMTGKRDGKAFSVSRSTRLYAPNVQVGIYMNGRRITGQTVSVPKTGKVAITYVMDNKTPWTVSNVSPAYDIMSPCTIASIAPGKSGVCKYILDLADVAEGTKYNGAYRMTELAASFGGAWGQFDTIPGTTLVAR